MCRSLYQINVRLRRKVPQHKFQYTLMSCLVQENGNENKKNGRREEKKEGKWCSVMRSEVENYME